MLPQEHIRAFLILALCKSAYYGKERPVLIKRLYHRKVRDTEHVHWRGHNSCHWYILQGIAYNSQQIDENCYLSGFEIACFLVALCRHAKSVQLVRISIYVRVISDENTEVRRSAGTLSAVPVCDKNALFQHLCYLLRRKDCLAVSLCVSMCAVVLHIIGLVVYKRDMGNAVASVRR